MTPLSPSVSRGFTLIELLVALVIVGILSAIAYPSYVEHVRKVHRAEVTGLLLQNAHRMERHFARQGNYTEGTVEGLAKQSPVNGKPVYRLSLTLEKQRYELRATAVAGGPMADDVCANYRINQIGQRTPADPRCWRR